MNSLVRRKQVDSVHLIKNDGHHQLAKKLSVVDLVAIGVGTTIGAGVYILVGTVAREHTGPALAVSFFIAGVAAALSACCYAELASRCPSAGSAYHYAYICLGEGIAWLVGWALVLDYTIGGSAIARGITPNLASFFGGLDKLPVFLARQSIPGLGIVVDPCAALLIMIVTILLCFGIKESSLVQAIVTSVNVCTLIFIIVVGGYLACKTGWAGYDLPSGYFPFGLNGILAGSAVVFFSYIGFDTVTSTAEEVKNPQRDLPLGIGIALLICCVLYMLLSVVIVGLVPYYSLNPDAPISSAFGDSGMQWAAYILTTGAITALCASLLGSLLAQPRIFMAMARDGLLPAFFSEISPRTQVPVKSTIAIGVLAAALAFFMDVAQLSEMVSVGTLMAFTAVAVCVLVLRYVPPDGVPLPSSSQTWTDTDERRAETETFLVDAIESSDSPLLGSGTAQDEKYFGKRRKIASDGTDVRALFELSLLDQSGKGKHKVHSHFDRALESGPYTLKYRGSMWGYKRFFRRGLLETSDFLKDDCLKINCTVGVVVSEIDCPRLHSIHVPASCDIGSHFGMLLENEDGSDITFNVSGEKFRAHRLVLAARSPVFESEFLDVTGEEDRDIEVTDMDPKVFKALLHYMYKDALVEDAESSSSSGPSASDSLAAKLLGAADKYKLPRLSLMCESVLCKDISVDSVANVLALADRYNASALKSVCLKFAAENLIAVMRSDGFDYLREHCPSLQSELLKTVAGCEEELSGGGKTRSVWGQFSDGGADTNERSGRQPQTWGEINGGAERSQSVWVQVVNANASGRNNNDNNNSDDPMAED